ncbi:MAG: sensor histidine kinase [Eubacteriales bacterium]|nr:sensor histidine kinase [Eubacteriales bacterium]
MRYLYNVFRTHYRNSHLQTKFTFVLMITVILPALMIVLFFYGRLYDMVVADTIRREQDASAQTAPLIKATVDEVLDAYDKISSHDFYKFLGHMTSEYSMNDLMSSADAQDFSDAVDLLQKQGLITNIRVYMDFPKAYVTEAEALYQDASMGRYFAPVSQIRGTYWYGIFQGTHSTELYCPSFYLGTLEKESYGDSAYIHAGSFLYEGHPYRIYTAVYYSSARFSRILSDHLALKGSVSYIMNERNSLVASSNESLSGIYWLDYDAIRTFFMNSNNFVEQTILDRKVYAGFYSITEPEWFMVTILPAQPLVRKSNLLMLQFFLFYLFVILLALMLASFLSRSITHRISSVISQMRKVRQGTLVPMKESPDHDEIGDLINTYNYMTKKMNLLMEQQAQAAEDLRVAEFKSLQAQINPHFLYNTMDMINWLATQGRTSEISSAVQNLSRFYKLTLSRKTSISNISQEVEHVTIYVRLQNMRYHDSITLICDIPDELTEYQIPKLTLQPVVENAILHGILAKESKSGTIVLTAWMEGSDIILLISDDGVGMPVEKQKSILTGSGQSASGGTNIAVYNTHRRLQVLYGKDYGLSYHSQSGVGTEVQIRLPAHR